MPIAIANLSILQNKLSILENNNTKLIQNVDEHNSHNQIVNDANNNPNTVFEFRKTFRNDNDKTVSLGGYTKKNNFKYNRIKTRKIKPKSKK